MTQNCNIEKYNSTRLVMNVNAYVLPLNSLEPFQLWFGVGRCDTTGHTVENMVIKLAPTRRMPIGGINVIMKDVVFGCAWDIWGIIIHYFSYT